MANKKALLDSMKVKVKHMSGFDKSGFNALTAPLGAIVPLRKQLVLPGKVHLSVKLSAQLPPLATDAFLRTHLKVEAFFVPLRICYGGFMSWISGEPICTNTTGSNDTQPLTRASLPRLRFLLNDTTPGNVRTPDQTIVNVRFGAHSLCDYFDVKLPVSNGNIDLSAFPSGVPYFDVNIFPFLAYQLIYHHWYRNKLVERPVFSPPDFDTITSSPYQASTIPFVSWSSIKDFSFDLMDGSGTTGYLLNGTLTSLRQRNYGYDYFSTALPSAQEGNPMSVNTTGNSFTISQLRTANALQEFAERNQIAGPDYIQVLESRYGKAPSAQVASKPVLLGSADFPMFTAGVEQTAQGNGSGATQNPFAGIAAQYGRAHAEGSDFVCDSDITEPGYLMVLASLVPEANYSSGIAHDMRIFTQAGSLVDLPVAQLENTGYEPISASELDGYKVISGSVFGYQPRYMWHKAGAGAVNGVHGLFREGYSLASFIPQRNFSSSYNGPSPQISTSFLKVKPTDLDDVMAVSGSLSQYGVMIDSNIRLFVSEPLSESVLPSLVDPAQEHGHEVYLSRGGSKLE